VRGKHRFDFRRIDVLAAADDHVALAVDEVDQTVGVGAQHADKAGLGRAVELEQAAVREQFEDRALGLGARRRRRDQQLADARQVVARLHRGGQVEHHDVVRRH
jgi:hypothetical protein